jgi:hypothetical protein
MAKGRDTAVQQKRFEARETARKIDNLDAMIRDFQTLAADLDRQIAAEEDRTGVRDRGHFAYSLLAKAAAQRRDNLRASAAELDAQRASLVARRIEAERELSDLAAVPPDPARRPHNGRSRSRA